jgi:hypothetical protein
MLTPAELARSLRCRNCKKRVADVRLSRSFGKAADGAILARRGHEHAARSAGVALVMIRRPTRFSGKVTARHATKVLHMAQARETLIRNLSVAHKGMM